MSEKVDVQDVSELAAAVGERVWVSIHPRFGATLCAVCPDGPYYASVKWGEDLGDGNVVLRVEVEREYVYIVTKLIEVDGGQETQGMMIEWSAIPDWVREHGEPVPTEAAQVGLNWLGLGGPKT